MTIKTAVARYFSSYWLPGTVYLLLLAGFVITSFVAGSSLPWKSLAMASMVLFAFAAVALLGILAAAIWNFIQKRPIQGVVNLVAGVACIAATGFALSLLFLATAFGPSADGFADNLKIPEGIEIAEPADDTSFSATSTNTGEPDPLQLDVRRALAIQGNDQVAFAPLVPSLRNASTDHARLFREYIDASPDWHGFTEQGNHFASRCWSYDGEPRQTLHGYVSDFSGTSRFQTRCLLCLDRKQWSRYSIEKVPEGTNTLQPKLTRGNDLHESRVMIDCGGVWVEIFEQSGDPERRVTKATLFALEREFSEFVRDPERALDQVKNRSRTLATRRAPKDGHPFHLRNGMQPGIYEVTYSFNPGEPGSVYLKAFEVTQGTRLSEDRLGVSSGTRMPWSTNATERFGAKAGFTIYEGDWGKPYAARFEVWFKPDSGAAERKLAERTFKIEGWQR
jgi:hypothetical protein